MKAYWREAGYSGEVVSNGGRALLDCKSGPISIVYDGTTHNQVAALVGFIAGNSVIEWDEKTVSPPAIISNQPIKSSLNSTDSLGRRTPVLRSVESG